MIRQLLKMRKHCCVSSGKSVVLVPAIPGLYNSLDRHLGHFKRYSKIGLRDLIEKAGLKFGGSRYFNAGAIPGWWYSGSLLKERDCNSV